MIKPEISMIQVVKLYQDEGRPLRECGQILGCAGSTVGDRLRQLGIPIRSRGWYATRNKTIPLDVPTLVAQYASGMSAQAIATAHGVDATTIRRRLYDAGVTFRGNGGSHAGNRTQRAA
jgi:hypothetical protein